MNIYTISTAFSFKKQQKTITMKKKLTTAVLFLLLVTGIAACKKQDSNTTIVKIGGKWQVTKIETKVYDANGGVTSSNTVEYNPSSDYLDFKSTENNDFEMSLAGTISSGNYVTFVGTAFNIKLASKLLVCTTEVLDDNTFQFTATVDQSNPKVTETYYLKR